MTTQFILFAGIGILLIALSIPLILEYVKPNRWYGFRFTLTLNNTRIWYPANRFGGKLLLAYGVAVLEVGVLLPMLSVILQLGFDEEIYSYCMVVILITGVVLILLLIWRYIKYLEKELEQNDASKFP
ncbi:MAG: SdpI family protein [Anaerolineales bacterium]|jgi:uncharacterized membrane protein